MTHSAVLRRTLTVLLLCGAVFGGFSAIRVAAAWTASGAPLEVSPIAPDVLRARLANEQDRSARLQDRLVTLTSHAQELESALMAAQARLDTDRINAQDLAAQLATAKQKLAALERSIRQARAAQSTVVVTTSSVTGRGSEGERGDD